MEIRWLKNSDGKEDAMLTLGLIAFLMCCVWITFGVLGTLTLGQLTFTFREPSAGNLGIVLGGTLGAYVARRNEILSRKYEMKRLRKEKKNG